MSEPAEKPKRKKQLTEEQKLMQDTYELMRTYMAVMVPMKNKLWKRWIEQGGK